MTFKTGLAAVGTAVLAVGMLAATAFADAPPAASKKKAYAAEPAKAESYDRPHVGNWGGLYAGVNLGWINGDVDRDYFIRQESGLPPPLEVGSGFTRGALGGHVGIQHQFQGGLIVGIEAAGSGPGPFGKWSSSVDCGPPAAQFVGGVNCLQSQKSLYTFGPRIGWGFDRWMVFATGGLAKGTLNAKYTNKVNGADIFTFEQGTSMNTGWFLGAGVEWAMTSNWILGLEYQHYDLGGKFASHVAESSFGPNFVNDFRLSGEGDLVRLRLSYKLNRPEAAGQSTK